MKQKQSDFSSKGKERTAGRIADTLDNSTSVGSMGKNSTLSLKNPKKARKQGKGSTSSMNRKSKLNESSGWKGLSKVG